MNDESAQEDLKQRWCKLITIACQYPPGHPIRQRHLTQLIREVTPYLTKYRRTEDLPYYPDALQQTWHHFSRCICPYHFSHIESLAMLLSSLKWYTSVQNKTAINPEKLNLWLLRFVCYLKVPCKTPYNPDKGRVDTWLKVYLDFRILDLRSKEWKRQTQETSWTKIGPDGEEIEIEPPDPPPPPVRSRYEQVLAWVAEDKTGELRKCHLKGKPEVNCQMITLRRLSSPPTKWEDLAEEYGVPFGAITAHFSRRCKPLLGRFEEQE